MCAHSLASVALTWDEEVSRLHAELRRIGDEWTLLDDGLSLNGSFVNGELVRGHRRLHDGDTLRLGGTVLVFRNPAEAESMATAPAADLRQAVSLSDAQRRVLIALCRPFKTSTVFVTPAKNEQIAGELFLSVDAVKKHMRALFEKFGIAHLPRTRSAPDSWSARSRRASSRNATSETQRTLVDGRSTKGPPVGTKGR